MVTPNEANLLTISSVVKLGWMLTTNKVLATRGSTSGPPIKSKSRIHFWSRSSRTGFGRGVRDPLYLSRLVVLDWLRPLKGLVALDLLLSLLRPLTGLLLSLLRPPAGLLHRPGTTDRLLVTSLEQLLSLLRPLDLLRALDVDLDVDLDADLDGLRLLRLDLSSSLSSFLFLLSFRQFFEGDLYRDRGVVSISRSLSSVRFGGEEL